MKRTRASSAVGSPATRVVIYARVSSKEQEKEGFSIPAQQRLLRDYAAAHRFTVLKEFVDVETAKKSGRANFTAMVELLRTPFTGRSVILVEKTDRLYRNFKDYVTLDELDAELHFVKENEVISKDSRSSAKFMHAIRVVMAKQYIDNLSEETRKGMQQKAEEGLYPARAPIGYLNVPGQDGKKRLQPDPASAAGVLRLFETYDSGNVSLAELVPLSREIGLQGGEGLTRAGIHRVLRTSVYCGEYEWGGQTHQGVHTPIVSRELWQRVQERLAGRYTAKLRTAKHDFAFSGLIKCGHCGCALVGDIKKGKYVYYRCTGYKQKCGEPYTRESVLEAQFTGLLRQLHFDDEMLG